MYILSNEHHLFGASAILYPDITKMLIEFYESNDMGPIKQFVHEECIDGIDFQVAAALSGQAEEKDYILSLTSCTTLQVAGLLAVKDRRARVVLGSLVKKKTLKKSGNAGSTVYLADKQFPTLG